MRKSDSKLDTTKVNRKQMEEYENAYRAGKPIISDEEWDKLVKETGYEEKVGDTGRIYDKSANGRNLIPMKTPLISLNKTSNKSILRSFFTNKENEDKEFIIEPKLDGNAFNAIYEVEDDGKAYLRHIGSSGDGLKSLECFENALDTVSIFGLPKNLSSSSVEYLRNNGFVIDNTIEFRGEAIINVPSWKNKNSKYITGIESWRSMAAGILNRKIPSSLAYVLSTLEEREFDIKNVKDSNTKKLRKYGLDKDIINYIDKDLNISDENISDSSNKDENKYIISVRSLDKNFSDINMQNEDFHCRTINTVYDKTRFKGFDPEYMVSHYIQKEDALKTIVINGEKIDFNKFKASSPKITSLIESIDFIVYSISSEDGNKDDINTISTIGRDEGLIFFNLIPVSNLIKKCSAFDSSYKTTESDGNKERDFFKPVNDICMHCSKVNSGDSSIKSAINVIGSFFGDKEWNPNSNFELRKDGIYICDGIVIKTIEADKGVMRTGRLAHHPTNRIAIKLLGKKYRTKLIKIESSITELGNETMHGVIEPIRTDDGSVITNINLHNPSWLKRNSWIQEGIDVDVVMSADLIPILVPIDNKNS